MNPSARRRLALSVAIFCAAILQMVVSSRIAIHGVQPDLLLTVALVGSLYCDVNGAALLGFCAGLIQASVTAPPEGFGSMIVSRTVACMLAGWLEERLFRDSASLALVVVAAGSIVAELLFFIGAPHHNVLHWLREALLGALYAEFLAVPTYLLVRLAVQGRRPRQLV